jgi:hypothetical protein
MDKILIPTYDIKKIEWSRELREERVEQIVELWARWWSYHHYHHYHEICRNGERL